MRILSSIIICCGSLLLSSMAAARSVSPSDIIPRPTKVTISKGVHNLSPAFNPDDIPVSITSKLPAEAYTLSITPEKIKIKAGSEAGAFYARQSLRQMLMADSVTSLTCAEVYDSPRFPYRGLHFDVSRHFRDIPFLKKQIDAMALMKLNRMHIHLTDAAGWRIQIDRYPELTDLGAWRPIKDYMQWWDHSPRHYCRRDDPGAYGGFYTKDELRDLVSYAARRHITIIPEIEMPGHSEEVVTAYPGISCSGKPYSSGEVCPGKEETFEFLCNVLDEVMDIFPSEYIHIGGDEAGKQNWKNCLDCQRRMKEENLEDLNQLQSYLIKRMERHVNSRGRHIIGWDEILEGGAAPNSTIMSWRGTSGGIAAMKSGHHVVMTPGEYCYIDFTQDAPFREPRSIGGYTPLEKVYGYEPADSSLTSDELKFLDGIQANLWSEYVIDDSHAEYMYYPRAYAIAETGWSSPEKDYADFHRRALIFNSILKDKGYNVFDLADEYGQRPESLNHVRHLGEGAKVTYTRPWHSQYPAAEATTLTDGIRGGWSYGDGRWQGFLSDIDVTVDLGKVQPIHYIGATFMLIRGPGVLLPETVEYFTSVDGINFTPAGTVCNDIDLETPKLVFKDFGIVPQAPTEARYVRMYARRDRRLRAWLFTDELIIN